MARFPPNGVSRRTTAKPSTTKSPARDEKRAPRKSRPGRACRRRCNGCWLDKYNAMVRRFFLKAARRRTLDRELEAELAFHREMAEAGGNTLPLGSAARIKEASGDPWRFTLLESLW